MKLMCWAKCAGYLIEWKNYHCICSFNMKICVCTCVQLCVQLSSSDMLNEHEWFDVV